MRSCLSLPNSDSWRCVCSPENLTQELTPSPRDGFGFANRAADAIEKITRSYPALRQRHKVELLGLMAETQQQELRWHLAAMIPRISLTDTERHTALSSLIGYLEDGSSIVKTFASQGLADLAQSEAAIDPG
jgi:hypothetical protein